MEKRAILAAVLMAAVFIVYQMFFLPVSQESPAPQKASEKAAAPAPEAPAAPTAPAPPPGPPAPRGAPKPRPPQRLATVEAPLYRAVVSSEGGKFQELVLKYRGEKPMVIVGDLGPAGLLLAPDASASPAVVAMSLDKDTVTVTGDRPADLVLMGETEGLRIRQTLRFHPDGYAVDAVLRVENSSGVSHTVALSLPWFTRQAWRATPEKFQGQHPTEIVWSANGSVERIEDLSAVSDHVTDGDWVALGSVWYLAALVPKSSGFKLVITSEGKVPEAKNGDKAPAGRASVAVKATPTIAPGQAWEGTVVLYAGPKEYERLKALGLQPTINFGGFPLPRRYGGLPMDWLGVPILLLM